MTEALKDDKEVVAESADRPWGKQYKDTVPRFGGEQDKKKDINDGNMVQEMLAQSAEEQDMLANPTEEDLDEYARRERILTDALLAQGSGKFKGKTIEEILTNQLTELGEQLEKTPDKAKKEALVEEMQRVQRVHSWAKDFREYTYKNGESQPASSVNLVEEMDKLDENIASLEERIARVQQKRAETIEIEKKVNGYDENDGHTPPANILGYDKQLGRMKLNLKKEKEDVDLMIKIYKANGKEGTVSKEDIERALKQITAERDVLVAKIDVKISFAEKDSDEWKKLRDERREAYRVAPDESIERVSAKLGITR